MPHASTPLEDVKDDHDDLVFLEEQAVPATGTAPGARMAGNDRRR